MNDVDNLRADNDGAWKRILNTQLEDFTAFFWPEAHEAIDWLQPYQPLEQELLALNVKDAIGKRNIDKLFRVTLKSGQEQWLLLHVEVQHFKDETFPQRMFCYYYRCYDRYQKDIASMAILVDKDPNWRPNQYYRRIWKSDISRTYEVVKLIDFKSKVEDLKKHSNPFGLVVLIQLSALETQADNENRLLSKLEFFRALHQHGWPLEQAMDMYRFLDAMLSLHPKFELSYIEQAKKIDEEHNMQLTLTAERYGFEQGIQQGVQQGEAEILTSQLKAKFQEVPNSYVEKIGSADPDTLKRWAVNFVHADSLQEVFKA